MSVRDVVDLLACPHCRGRFELTPGGRALRCAVGHVFDLGRQGYVNLLGRAAPSNADTAAMVAARDRFLSAGHFRSVADRLLSLALAHSAEPRRLLDVGTGPGYYLGRLLDGLPAARGIGLDVSVAAARRAARAAARVGAVVADAWQPLPVATGSVDVVLNVFAPRNPSEFHRVLVAGGALLTVTPEPDHLDELRDTVGLLDIQPAKSDQLRSTLATSFIEESFQTLRYSCQLGGDAVQDLVAMGPNAFHLSPAEIAARAKSMPAPVTVTVAVRLTRWAAYR